MGVPFPESHGGAGMDTVSFMLAVEALSRYGRRRPPVIPFLDRNHFLNRGLGKLRVRISRSSTQ